MNEEPDYLEIEYRPRDWEEDAVLENGNYFNNCIVCSETFLGHKQRIICKTCAAKPKDTYYHETT